MQTTQMLLEQCQEEADELEQRWLDAKARCASLIRELKEYTSQSWPTSDQYQVAKHKTSLDELPDELLCEMFEYATHAFHPSILSLLLVCKRFHWIIMSTSSLWTRVDLMFHKDLMSYFLPTKNYVEACLKRSRGRLLDITIEFPRHTTATSYALDQVVAKMTPIIGRDASMDLQGALFDVEWRCDSSVVEERVNCLEAVAKSLIGSNGEHMLRWRSLSMKLPEDEWVTFFLTCMADYPAPDLQRLEITNMKFLDDDGDYSLPSMPHMYSLKTDELYLHWLDPAPVTLTHLDTAYGRGLIFDHLSGLQHLRHLSIRKAIDSSLYEKDPIALPHLSELHIYGTTDRVLASLVMPQLKTLFVCSSQTKVTQLLPLVPLIEWNFDKSELEGTFEVHQRNALTSIFPKMRETRCLRLQGFRVGLVEGTIKKKKQGGGLPAGLKVVEILVDDARTTIMTGT